MNLKTSIYTKVKLTESKLKQIVAESVNRILKEGKVVNNKPFFIMKGEKPKDQVKEMGTKLDTLRMN